MDHAEHTTDRSPCPDGGDRYHRLVCAHAGVALIATDVDLNVQLWNSAASRIFGTSGGQMIGKSILTLLPKQRRDEIEPVLRGVIAEGETREFQFPQRDAAGAPKHLAATITPLTAGDGQTCGLAVGITDVTRFTERLQKAGQGRKMAALGDMAGAISHHFNNILGGLVTSVDFALAADDPELERRALEQTARSLARATRLLEHLLAFAEGHHRQDDLGDLTEVVYQAMELAEPEAAEANVQLTLNMDTLPVTPVPRQKLLTIIFNVTHNAIDAMADGGSLRIDVEHTGDGCFLRFTDTGCGMDQDKLERIFEPFYSTKHVAAKAQEHAPGFGLAIVHGILHEIGGRIVVESRVGQGTTVEVRLPCDADPFA